METRYTLKVGEEEYQLGVLSGPIAVVFCLPAIVVVLFAVLVVLVACVIIMGAAILALPGLALAYPLTKMGV